VSKGKTICPLRWAISWDEFCHKWQSTIDKSTKNITQPSKFLIRLGICNPNQTDQFFWKPSCESKKLNYSATNRTIKPHDALFSSFSAQIFGNSQLEGGGHFNLLPLWPLVFIYICTSGIFKLIPSVKGLQLVMKRLLL
jgi:hypothetical protein